MIGIIFIVVSVIGYFLILNKKVKNKGALLLEKATTAFLSALLYSLFIAYFGYTPAEEQEANVESFTFGSLFEVSFMYSLPVFLICGGLYSFYVDIYLNNIYFRNTILKYITGLSVYLVGGILIVGVFYAIILLINGSFNELFGLGLFKVSTLPSLLFYHISLLSKKTSKLVME